jgi:tetraacyldisaccharide 4'-kinase
MISTVMSLPWSTAAAAKAWVYARGWLARHELARPTISIGALEMGGTGKTPTTMAVTRALLDAGLRPAIVSRGYGRVGGEPLLVSPGDGNGPVVTAAAAGDEPWLMAHLLPEVPVAVAARRELAAAHIAPDHIDAFVLDDAFQHLRVARALDFLVVDGTRPFWQQTTPPLGRLRERPAAAGRADAFLLRGPAVAVPERWDKIPRYALTPCPTRLVPLQVWLRDPDADGNAVPDTPCVAFAGIAHPRRFFDELGYMGVQLSLGQSYRDHQAFSRIEMAGLAERARLRDSGTLITTEKDAARLAHLDVEDLDILVATHRLQLAETGPLLAAAAAAGIGHQP